MQYFILKDRSVISVSGKDSKTLLQGLITNDIKLLNNTNLIYALFLNPNSIFAKI